MMNQMGMTRLESLDHRCLIVSDQSREALLNFQTMVSDLTGMEIANASLLDESTAAAEAMALLFAVRDRKQKKDDVNKFFVSEEVLPQTISLIKTRAEFLGIDIVLGDHAEFDFSAEFN